MSFRNMSGAMLCALVCAAPAADAQTVNFVGGGFETPSYPNSYSSSMPPSSGWTGYNSAGLAGGANWMTDGVGAAPQGTQVAYITRSSSISQAITLSPGRYVIALKAAQCYRYQERSFWLKISMNGTEIGRFAPPGYFYSQYITPAFTVSAPGSYTFTFEEANPDTPGISTLLLDEVRIVDPAEKPRNDFTGDGRSDILWHNSTSGAVSLMQMNGLVVTAHQPVFTQTAAGFKVAGTGDFNGDGKTDILWYHPSTLQLRVTLMNGFTALSETALGTSGYPVAAIADFNGDGKSDVLFENGADGRLGLWLMDGAAVASSAQAYFDPNPALRTVGVGDFNGDGRADILRRDSVLGDLAIQYVDGTTFKSRQALLNGDDLAWKVVTVADFNGDGNPDILWRSGATGAVRMTLLNGATVTADQTVYIEPNPTWKIIASGDFDGDGKADILWRNDVGGHVFLMLMDGFNIAFQLQIHLEPDLANRIVNDVQAEANSAAILAMNASPMVSVLSPAANTLATGPANLLLAAAASDADGSVAKVEFFDGATLLATVTSAPYTFAWNGVQPGIHLVRAKATDDSGHASVSPATTVYVSNTDFVNGGFETPVYSNYYGMMHPISKWIPYGSVGIAGGLNEMTYNNPAAPQGTQVAYITRSDSSFSQTLTLQPGTYRVDLKTAQRYLYAERLCQLKIRVNGSEIGSFTPPTYYFYSPYQTAPFTVSAAGNYTFTFGEGTPSNPLNCSLLVDDLRLLTQDTPPSVSLVAHANNTLWADPGSNVTLTATASTANGAIAKVEFFNGGALIGTAYAPPYAVSMPSVAEGVYTLTAKATDTLGHEATSAAVSLKVLAYQRLDPLFVLSRFTNQAGQNWEFSIIGPEGSSWSSAPRGNVPAGRPVDVAYTVNAGHTLADYGAIGQSISLYVTWAGGPGEKNVLAGEDGTHFVIGLNHKVFNDANGNPVANRFAGIAIGDVAGCHGVRIELQDERNLDSAQQFSPCVPVPHAVTAMNLSFNAYADGCATLTVEGPGTQTVSICAGGATLHADFAGVSIVALGCVPTPWNDSCSTTSANSQVTIHNFGHYLVFP